MSLSRMTPNNDESAFVKSNIKGFDYDQIIWNPSQCLHFE